MLTLWIVAGLWALCGMIAFAILRFRKRSATHTLGLVLVQLMATIVLGGIALFAAVTDDEGY